MSIPSCPAIFIRLIIHQTSQPLIWTGFVLSVYLTLLLLKNTFYCIRRFGYIVRGQLCLYPVNDFHNNIIRQVDA